MIDTIKPMRAFHGDAELKKNLLAEVAKHRKADMLVKGDYGSHEMAEFRGCAVGCSLHSLSHLQDKRYNLRDHSAYEPAAGVPRLLARVQDRIFEGLPPEDAMLWPERFWEAIPVGADLKPAAARWLAWIFGDEEIGIWRCWKNKEDQGVIKAFGTLKGREGNGETITMAEWQLS
jgi:hypothetical protein